MTPARTSKEAERKRKDTLMKLEQVYLGHLVQRPTGGASTNQLGIFVLINALRRISEATAS